MTRVTKGGSGATRVSVCSPALEAQLNTSMHAARHGSSAYLEDLVEAELEGALGRVADERRQPAQRQCTLGARGLEAAADALVHVRHRLHHVMKRQR